jgi:hypothetical protein
VVGLVLLVLTPVFEKLPLNVMGAIVVSGVSGLFEYEQAVHLFKVRRAVASQCFASMMLFDVSMLSVASTDCWSASKRYTSSRCAAGGTQANCCAVL